MLLKPVAVGIMCKVYFVWEGGRGLGVADSSFWKDVVFIYSLNTVFHDIITSSQQINIGDIRLDGTCAHSPPSGMNNDTALYKLLKN